MSRRGRGKKRPLVRKAATHRIRTLYDLSIAKAREGDMVLARRYLELARKVGMRYTIRIPREMKMVTCKGCMAPLVPGITSRTRSSNGNTVITCLECGRIKRYSHQENDKDEE